MGGCSGAQMVFSPLYSDTVLSLFEFLIFPGLGLDCIKEKNEVFVRETYVGDPTAARVHAYCTFHWGTGMYSTLVSTTIYVLVLVEGKSNTNRPRNYPSQNSKRAVTETFLSNNIVGRGGKKPTTRERYGTVQFCTEKPRLQYQRSLWPTN